MWQKPGGKFVKVGWMGSGWDTRVTGLCEVGGVQGREASGKDEVWVCSKETIVYIVSLVGSEVTTRAGREVWKVGLTRAEER